MDARKIATEIVDFYESHHGIGNTKALATGTLRDSRTRLIVVDEPPKRHRTKRVINFAQIEAGALRTNKFPVVVDNGAVTVLLKALIAEPEPEKTAKPKKTAKKAT